MDRLRKKIESLEARNRVQEDIIDNKNRIILKLTSKIEQNGQSMERGGKLIDKLRLEIERINKKNFADLAFAESKFKKTGGSNG
jgi:uncharacterized coiled-coil protein SlyX